MDTAYLVLIVGGAVSALVSLFGIWLTKRDNLDTLDLISPEELKSYRISRLVSSGIAWCSMGKHEFRPGPGESATNCKGCLPPAPDLTNQILGRQIRNAEHGQAQPYNRERFGLLTGKSYRPLYMDYPEFGKKEEDND